MYNIKLEFHDADTDTDILADILARIVARMSACHLACHRNNFRKSRVSDVSARILARMSVSVSVTASWNSSLKTLETSTVLCTCTQRLTTPRSEAIYVLYAKCRYIYILA